jgi:hypothetical protein
MSDDERINEILITIQKIKDSKEPVRRYFRNNYVPFSQAQYYNLSLKDPLFCTIPDHH